MRCNYCFEQNERCSCDGKFRQDALLLPAGHKLNGGQYIVGKVLGNPGGFGITYLGWDTRLEIKIAIKEYLPRHLARRSGNSNSVESHTRADQEGFDYGLSQFLYEAKTLAQLRHSSIVRVLNYFEENDTGYIVMDYLDGENLQEYMMRTGPIRPEDALTLMAPILNALEYLHCNGIIHRDVKPSNIFITLTGHPVLLDFGSARQEMSSASMSMTAVVSAGYAPIEQYNRKGKQGPYSDIYSCAALLYQMISGIQPQESIERNIDDEVSPLSTVVPGVPSTINDAIMWGLALNPKERPQEIRVFIKALDCGHTIDTGSSVEEVCEELANDSVKTVSEQSRELKLSRRKGSKKLLAGVAALLLVGCSVAYWSMNGEKTIDHKIIYDEGKKYAEEYSGKYKGQVTWNKPNGQGTFIGQRSSEKKSHIGDNAKYINTVTIEYSGQFKNGLFHGKGVRTSKVDGRLIENQASVNYSNNPTHIEWVSTYRVEAEWLNGRANGKGKSEISGYKRGFVRDSGQNRIGIIEFMTKYEGFFKDDLKHGQGIEWEKEGDYLSKREGEWKGGSFLKGKVDESSYDGRYVGEYFDGEKHGEGKYINSDNEIYTGGWKKGKRDGKGKFTYPDGSYYSGLWINNRIFSGEFMFARSGVKYVGMFKDGRTPEEKAKDKDFEDLTDWKGIPAGEGGLYTFILPNGRTIWGRCWGKGSDAFECEWTY